MFTAITGSSNLISAWVEDDVPPGAGANAQVEDAHVAGQDGNQRPDAVFDLPERVDHEGREEEHHDQVGRVADPVGQEVACVGAGAAHMNSAAFLPVGTS